MKPTGRISSYSGHVASADLARHKKRNVKNQGLRATRELTSIWHRAIIDVPKIHPLLVMWPADQYFRGAYGPVNEKVVRGTILATLARCGVVELRSDYGHAVSGEEWLNSSRPDFVVA